MILRNFKIVISKKNLICNNCINPILKNTQYRKYSDTNLYFRLHEVCFRSLSLDSITQIVKNLKD